MEKKPHSGLHRIVRGIAKAAVCLSIWFWLPQGMNLQSFADGWHRPPFNSNPLDFWRRNRERLGFSPQEPDPRAPRKRPEIDDLDASEKQYQKLLETLSREKDPQQRKNLQQQIGVLGEAITAYKMEISGKTGGKKKTSMKRRAFIHGVIQAMAYVNPENLSFMEFPDLMKNRKRFMAQLQQILSEIGPQAAPQLWEHLRNEIVFHGEVKQPRVGDKKSMKQLVQRIQELRQKQRTAKDKPTWTALEGHIKGMQERLTLLQGRDTKHRPENTPSMIPGVRGRNSWLLKNHSLEAPNSLPYDRLGFIVSKDYIEMLSRALIALGPKGMDTWLSGFWDPNPSVRKKAIELGGSMGREAVQRLLQGLRQETSELKRRGLSQALVEITGEDFQGDAGRYEAWLKENKPLVVKPGGDKPSDLPPGMADHGKQKNKEPEELIIGPRE